MKHMENRRHFPVGIGRLGICTMLVFIMAFVLMLGMTGMAKADPPTEYNLWIGGTQVTSETLTINGDTGTATFNPDTKTLTLKNYRKTITYTNDYASYPGVIYCTGGFVLRKH